MELKYLYFEIHTIRGVGVEESEMLNENALVFKPKTNSSGYWSYTTITRRVGSHTGNDTDLMIVQYWIDLEKYDGFTTSGSMLKERIEECLTKLNEK